MNTLHDIRFAFRMLLKRPGFTVIVILTLALGIGANTTIFSAIDAVLLNPLPYKDPERLVVVWETNKQLGPEMGDRNEVAIGNFLDWRSRNQVFEQLGSLFYTDMNLSGLGEPERIKSCVVTANLFQVLGVQPMLGRSFLPDEERPGSPSTVIISHDLWQRLFGSDRNVINKTLTLNGRTVAVVGVMPPAFELQFPTSMRVEMWVPMRIDTDDLDRSMNFLYALARAACIGVSSSLILIILFSRFRQRSRKDSIRFNTTIGELRVIEWNGMLIFGVCENQIQRYGREGATRVTLRA